ncbi:hypothetical protein [Wenyingzhuangia marina]|uniref:Beta-lactamase-inhibitor-like, PepSY-like n=1 Tax=Wenyingzhuangia marina TaxID=1195760 RepID=A0A1M5U0K9_9FLAO|nr:hypothetical protein [Wenyingzhuangia marina]GGF70152.1 hypothetical protein GCM10011397_11330 [Wenyingzhuangia marina]SHH56562.1 hypothetical protein SAMN05444281_0962 [Wenyingzhuangia marina]
MKKVILSIAILASGVATYAIPTPETPINTINIIMNDGFTEVAVDKLPEAVTNAVKTDFETATISKAYVNSSEQYKLELTTNGASSTVYVDKDGNWVKVSDIK